MRRRGGGRPVALRLLLGHGPRSGAVPGVDIPGSPHRQAHGRRAPRPRRGRPPPARRHGRRPHGRHHPPEAALVTATSPPELYYDPFDIEIDKDPHRVWKRMRDEAPLWWNEKHRFFALSRFADVDRALIDWDTYRSGRGSTLEIIQAGIEMPSGMILMEDPPLHDCHRGVMSRVFTPRKMQALEPKVREFCARSLDPLVGSGRFDFIADLGAQMPMRTIGMLLGIPEQDQEAIRDQIDAGLRLDEGAPREEGAAMVTSGDVFADYVDWRVDHPSDDLMTDL